MRTFVGILFVLVVLVVGAGTYVYLNAGSLVEQVIERVGTDATGTNVAVASVDIEIVQGTAAINGFTVDNPAGFSGGEVFTLNQISVALDTENTTGNLIVLNEVIIDNPEVLYEFGEGGTNIDALRANIQDFQNRMGGSGGGAGSGGENETKIIIDRLRFTGGTVTAIAAGEQVNVDLPPLTLTDLGRSSGGQTAAQIAVQISDRFTRHVTETVARSEVQRQLGIDGNIIENTVDRVRDLFGN